MLIYSKKLAHIKVLLFNKAVTKVLIEYSDYNYVFSVENAVELLKNTRMNKLAIKLKKVSNHFFDLYIA